MRRLLLVFLMLLMPLQSVWSAAASVCMHEQSKTAARHFGHHDPHHAEASSAKDSHDAAGDEQASEPSLVKAMDTDHHHVLSVNPVPHTPLMALPLASAQRDPPGPGNSFHSALVASLERPPQASADTLRQGS